jgi:hypothetical protein
MENKKTFQNSPESQKSQSSAQISSFSLKKKWSKKSQLFNKFNFSDRAGQMMFPNDNQKFRFFRKQSPRRKLRFGKIKFNSMMDKNLLNMFDRKTNLNKNTEGRNRFKLGDYGLSFNKFLGNLLNFGDNAYLAPEMLNSSDPHFKVYIFLRQKLIF